MSYNDCLTCGEIMCRPNHTCPPAWLVRNEDDDAKEAYTIYAPTNCGAAEEFCRRMDDGESLPRDRKVIVERKEPAGLKLGPTHFHMRAELVAQYLPF